jgi:hypothetical protein
MVYVFEHYRPTKEQDQMLLFIDGIDYVNKSISGEDWLQQRINFYSLNNEGRHKIILNTINLKDLPNFINDFIFYHKIEQPCDISLYALSVSNMSNLSVAIRNIIENNLWNK